MSELKPILPNERSYYFCRSLSTPAGLQHSHQLINFSRSCPSGTSIFPLLPPEGRGRGMDSKRRARADAVETLQSNEGARDIQQLKTSFIRVDNGPIPGGNGFSQSFGLGQKVGHSKLSCIDFPSIESSVAFRNLGSLKQGVGDDR